MEMMTLNSLDNLNQVLHGDSIEILKTFPDKSIDLIFTDPPYGHNNNNGDLIHARERALGVGELQAPRAIANDGEEANELFRNILPEMARVLVPGGCLCCCSSGGGGPSPQFARWSLWIDETPGFEFKQMVVWDKGPMGMGWHYRRSYEVVLVAQKKGAACKWYDTSHAVENILRPNKHWGKIIPREHHHPTEKPVGLAEFFINIHTQKGETVLDPFCGSGSTLEAARNLGRNYIGIELDEQYVKMSRERLDNPYTPLLFE